MRLLIHCHSYFKDFVISIAVIHHFCSEKRRFEALEEIVRVLRRGETALIFVWAFEQKGKRKPTAQDSCVNWIIDEKRGPNHVREEYARYYHLFKEGELECLVGKLEDAELVESGYDVSNWWAKIRKTL